VRIISRKEHHAVVGNKTVGTEVSEPSAAFTLAIETGPRPENIAATNHALRLSAKRFRNLP